MRSSQNLSTWNSQHIRIHEIACQILEQISYSYINFNRRRHKSTSQQQELFRFIDKDFIDLFDDRD